MSEDSQSVTVQYDLIPGEKIDQVREAVTEIADSMERIIAAQERLKELGAVQVQIEIGGTTND